VLSIQTIQLQIKIVIAVASENEQQQLVGSVFDHQLPIDADSGQLTISRRLELAAA
jgi:hypothetical protein